MEKPDSSGKENNKTTYSREDILKADTVADTLNVYRNIFTNGGHYNDIPDLQIAVADRLHQLGDDEKSSEFTLLSAQTSNSERNLQAAKIFGDAIDDFSRKVNQFGESSDGLKRFSDNLINSMEEFRITGSKISGAASQIDQASIRIESASRR